MGLRIRHGNGIPSAEEKLQQQKLVLEQADKAVPVEEARRRRLESDRKDQQQKLIKYREQSSSVKTNEQFHALQHEIGFVEAEIRRIEDEERKPAVAGDQTQMHDSPLVAGRRRRPGLSLDDDRRQQS